VFIVQAKPREPEGIVKVVRQTREEALAAAKNFLDQGMPFVTIVADGRVYTAEEFALTVINDAER
jgi:RNase P/RNase MRP subunit POP5